MSILERKDFGYIFFTGALTAVLAIMSMIPFMGNYSLSVTVIFNVIIIVQHFILLDIWITHKPIVHNFALVLKPIFLAAFFLPFVLNPIVLYHPFLNRVFNTVPLSLFEVTYSIVISFMIVVVLELTKIRHMQKVKSL